jgi:hypothetical protein
MVLFGMLKQGDGLTDRTFDGGEASRLDLAVKEQLLPGSQRDFRNAV